MSIKKSQQFSYFQNKAQHYDRIRNIKSVIDDKHSKSMRHTIDHASSPGRKRTNYLQQYQTKQQNQYMMNRLFNIMNSKKSPLHKLDSYSRFQKFERQFKNKSPIRHREAMSKSIDSKNKLITDKIYKIKPIVGSVDQWKDDYDMYVQHRNHLSRYQDDEEKGQLELSRGHYMPSSYRNFLSEETEDPSISSRKIQIRNTKLFQLPQLPTHTKNSRLKADTIGDTISLKD